MLSSPAIREIVRKRVLWDEEDSAQNDFGKGGVVSFCGMIWSCPVLELLYLSPLYRAEYSAENCFIRAVLAHCSSLTVCRTTRAGGWLMFHLSTRSSRSFSAKLLSRQSVPAYTGAQDYSSSGARLPFVELQKVPVDPFLQPVADLLESSTPIWCISHPSQFCVLCRRAEVRSAPSSRSLMKMLSNAGHSINLWIIP